MAKQKSVRHLPGSFSLTSTSRLKERERIQLVSPVKRMTLSSYLWQKATEQSVELNEDYIMDLAF